MSIIAEIKEKPLQGVIMFLLLVTAAALVYQAIGVSQLQSDIASIGGSTTSIKQSVRELSEDVSSLKSTLTTMSTTLNSVNSSLNTMKNSDVFAVQLIRLTTGNTWMFPVASAGWSGR